MESSYEAALGAPRWIGSPRHFGWLHGILKALLLLNLFDAIMTIAWITTGMACEANPLLADLAHTQPVLFTLAKTALVSLGCILLWRLRYRATAVVGIFIGFLAYYFLALYHLQALELNLLSYLH